MSDDNAQSKWDEDTSKRFLEYGRYFVPQREKQLQIVVDLLKGVPKQNIILELCCGEGLLAELILRHLPGAYVVGMDGSPVMLGKARERLDQYPGRYKLIEFDLPDLSWRRLSQPVQAVVSMLAIHHLDGAGKHALFQDIYAMLSAGGVFIIADMVELTSQPGKAVAAEAWDEVVRQRSLELDGDTAGLDVFRREGWNTYRYLDPDDIDHPSPLFDQLKWLAQAGFADIDVHLFLAGHALFSGWKKGDGG
ncbi:MAG TPA: methyltransferase domain-containing protein [Anaerolineales bacterium]